MTRKNEKNRENVRKSLYERVRSYRIPEVDEREQESDPFTPEMDRPWESYEPQTAATYPDLEEDEEDELFQDMLPPYSEDTEALNSHEPDGTENRTERSVEDETTDKSHKPRLRATVAYSSEAKRILDFKRIDQNNVVQGMIWSQVFASPRSKNPHHTNIRARIGRRMNHRI